MKEDDIRTVAKFLHRAVELSIRLQEEAGSKLLNDFKRVATDPKARHFGEVERLRQEIQTFAMKWPLPGVDVRKLKKPVNL
jgi:glycine hydroxymethyltransferase